MRGAITTSCVWARPRKSSSASRRTSPAWSGRRRPAASRAFDWRRAAREQAEAAARCGARLVLLGDAEYPASLRPIDLPPPFLLVRGELLREDALAVAIVGSRRATPYGAPDGRAAGRGPGGARGDGRQRAGAGRGHRGPPRRPRGGRADRRRPGLGRRRGVSAREPPAWRPRSPRPAPWSPSSRWGRPRCPTTSRRGTGSSRGSRSAPWSSRPPSGAARSSPRAARGSWAARSTRCPGTSRPPGARARTA